MHTGTDSGERDVMDIVFQRVPGTPDLIFVEVERDGRSVTIGEWITRDDDFVALRIPTGDG
jgi:hypothetical protein